MAMKQALSQALKDFKRRSPEETSALPLEWKLKDKKNGSGGCCAYCTNLKVEFQEFKDEKRREIKELNQDIGKLKSDLEKNNEILGKFDEDLKSFQTETNNNFQTLYEKLGNEFQTIRNEIQAIRT
jgi:chromosome segregation ATPase